MGHLDAVPQGCGRIGRGRIGVAFERGPLCRLLLALLLLLLDTMASAGIASTESEAAASERRIKAAFMHKFAEYIEWPASAFVASEKRFTIGVIGDDRLLRELQLVLAGREIAGREFFARRLGAKDSAEGVHMLFVARGSDAALVRVASNQRLPILLVSEVEGSLAQGATINFIANGTRIQFEVSLEDAERRQLKLGSRLLTVAQNTRRGP